MPRHKDLTEVDLHELKGAAAASANTVPVANGSGSTVFQKIGAAQINTSDIKNVNTAVLQLLKEAPATAFTAYVPIPIAATLVGVIGTLDSAPAANLTVNVYNDVTLLSTLVFPSAGSVPFTQVGVVSGVGNTFSAGTSVKVANPSTVASAGALRLTFSFTL